MLKVKDLRDSFIKFFEERNHKIVPSSSLIPKDDPTLLFTTAGMVQFKPMFAGAVKPDYIRAATVQKCLRTSDLENVGKTKRHCTFFEMLGNFSFGDYFKKEAIEYAWDYSTKIIKFPEEQIWISIYEDDSEAAALWHKHIGVPEKKIIRLGKKDNFWGPAGDSGACGPCSELYLDRGAEFGCGKESCRPGCDCERFLEYWNLVFNQFYQDETGKQTPLKQVGIDTGMGLERLATLVQGVDSIYHTDELKALVEFICRETGAKYNGDNISAINVMVEHLRTLTFAIADGAYPSNEGRGYVLRRILRRALRFERQIGIKEPFLYRMVDPLVAIMDAYYPETKTAAKNIKAVIEGEENRFLETLDNGMDRLDEILSVGGSQTLGGLKMKGSISQTHPPDLAKSSQKEISGNDAFLLYDTYGFPLEMTIEIAGEKGFGVNIEDFKKEMEKQRERGKSSWKSGGSSPAFGAGFDSIAKNLKDTVFKGYDHDRLESEIQFLLTDDGQVKSISAGGKGKIITAETPFYGESGGQIGDTGRITAKTGAEFRVDDTQRFNKAFIHIGEVIKGEIKSGDSVNIEIDTVRRNLIRANHTATHLLQAALRRVLGDHVHQAGSLVEPSRFRFDFSHFSGLSSAEIDEIENIVNEKIWEALPVKTEIMNIKEAVKSGALAVFDEKYEDTVRVVSAGDFSKELCGGTHVDNTAKIGVLKIIREGSPGAGLRRIEGITLKGVFERFKFQENMLKEIGQELNIPEAEYSKRVKDISERLSKLEKELDKFKTKNLISDLDFIVKKAVDINGVRFISHEFSNVNIDELRKMSDSIKSTGTESVVCFGSALGEKALLLCSATNSAVSNKGVDCGAIIKEISKHVGGSGGGRKDMAQAGGKNPDGINKALVEALNVAKKMIK